MTATITASPADRPATHAPHAPKLRVAAPDRAFEDLLAERRATDEPTQPEQSQPAPQDDANESAPPEAEPTSDQIPVPEAGDDPATGPNTADGIAHEVTHAAEVDLAALAGEELAAPKPAPDATDAFDGSRPAQQDPRFAPAKRPGDQNQHQGSQHRVPAGKADHAGSTTAAPEAPAPAAKRDALPVEPAPAPVSPEPAKGMHAATSAPASAVRADQAAAGVAPGRAALLHSLGKSAEAARGAVAAADRTGLGSAEREAPTTRTRLFAAAEPARASKEGVLNAVQRGLASVLTQGGGRMTVVLRPESLGEVRVRLTAREGVVNASLSATTDAARRTLEGGLEQLRESLEARGVRVESLTVEPGDDTEPSSQHREDHPNSDARRAPARTPARNTEQADPADAPPPLARRRDGIWTDVGLDAVA